LKDIENEGLPCFILGDLDVVMDKNRLFYEEIKNLGDRIQEKWEAKNLNYHFFPEIAFQELKEFNSPFPGIDSVIDHVQNMDNILPLDISESFGEPPVTLYRTDKFVVDLYFWFAHNTSNHSHGFRGAFKLLKGVAFQAIYTPKSFLNDPDLNPERLKTVEGKLLDEIIIEDSELTSLDFLNINSVSKISPELEFIHEVGHCSQPQVTLCVRTHDENLTQHRLILPNFLFVDTRTMDFRNHKVLSLIKARIKSESNSLSEKTLSIYRNWLSTLDDITLLAHNGKPSGFEHLEFSNLRAEEIRKKYWGETYLKALKKETEQRADYSKLSSPLKRALLFLLQKGVHPIHFENELRTYFELKNPINQEIKSLFHELNSKQLLQTKLNETAELIFNSKVDGLPDSVIKNQILELYECESTSEIEDDIRETTALLSKNPLLNTAMNSYKAQLSELSNRSFT
jgi:hypothetical protein